MPPPNNKSRVRHALTPGMASLKLGCNHILRGLGEVEAAVNDLPTLIVSPTGREVRDADRHGTGHFGATRGGGRHHKGADYIGNPGQDIVSPIHGTIIREAKPYANDQRWSGLLIAGRHLYVKMFYVLPIWSKLKLKVEQGEVIGTMQDIGGKYPGILPHVHLQVMIDPEIIC